MTDKVCAVCGERKRIDQFYPSKKARDGRQSDCKECRKVAVKKCRSNNIEYYRAYDRERSNLPHRLEQAVRISKRWKEMNPARRKAQVMLGNAVRDGRVEKQPCFICGDRAEAHHPDYSAPLDVVWLCSVHHKQAHHNT